MRLFVYISLFIVLFTSCEEVLFDNEPANTPKENFNFLWNEMNEKYAFFELKNMDWDSIYQVYEPKVEEKMNEIDFFNVIADMLFELRDGHVNLFAPFNVSRNWTWFLDYPQNFNYSVIERNYLKDDYFITGPFRHTQIKNAAYVYYGSFAQPVADYDIDFIVEYYANLKGIIIDVRDNGGGNPENGFTIASRFTSEKRHVYTTLTKTGPAHDDFGEEKKVYLSPDGDNKFTKKIILLTNRNCYSATTFFTAIMKALPNCTIVGDTTGGGGGVPMGGEMPNGWTYRFSVTKTLMPNNWNIELGVPADVVIDLNPMDETNGIDTILEEALRIIEEEE